MLSSRIIGKIPKGETSIVPTRPKHHIGKASGIDDAIYAATDQGTAQKILSLARYLLATNGQSFPGIITWQFMHPHPYGEGLSEDIYHDLFETVGRDESLIQSFFESRLSSLGGKVLLAYDSTTISTYSGRISEARYGFNKAHDGLETVKLLSLYSIENRQPVAFTAELLKNRKKLLSWLKNTPVYLTLQWFDAVEEVKVSTKLLSRRWITEITDVLSFFCWISALTLTSAPITC